LNSPESSTPAGSTNATPVAEAAGFASVYHGILKGSSVYSLAVILPKFTSLFLLPLYTHYLSPSDYGIMELVELTVSLVGLLFGSNLASGFLYFYFQDSIREARNATASSALLGGVVLGATAACCGAFCAAPISLLVFHTSTYAAFLRIAFVSFGLSVPMEVGYAFLRAENRPWLYVGANLFGLTLSITFNVVLLVAVGWRIQAILVSTLISSSTVVLVVAAFILRNTGIRLQVRRFLRILRYAAPVAIGTGSVFLLHFSDRFILMRYIPTSELGVYSLAYKFGMLVAFVQWPFSNYWTSQMYTLLRAENGAVLFRRVFTYEVTALTYAAVLLTAAAGPALQVLTTPAFRGAVRLIPWLAAAYVIRAAGDQFRCIYHLNGRPGLDARTLWSAGVTCVAASLLLIPRYGVWGAVASTIIGFSTVAIVGFFTSRRLFRFQLEWRRLGLAVLLGSVLCVLVRHLDTFHFAVRLAGGATAGVLFPLLLWVTGYFTAGERAGIGRALAALAKRGWAPGNGIQS
jgi:O-antigen/teichoic acid export membrane protein